MFDESFDLPQRFGGVWVEDAKSRLLQGSSGEEVSLNPYVGCAHACSYCYAASYRFAPLPWGSVVRVKTGSVGELRRAWRWHNKPVRIGLLADPYQPVEERIGLTRRVLETLSERPQFQPRQLTVMTRSPLVLRDIDIIKRFEAPCVQFSITTDNDSVRRDFEPMCPSVDARMGALKTLIENGVPVIASLSPLLPLKDAETFARSLKDIGVSKFYIDPFNPRGLTMPIVPNKSFTPDSVSPLLEKYGWTLQSYVGDMDVLKCVLGHDVI